jgi:hypothetical protein
VSYARPLVDLVWMIQLSKILSHKNKAGYFALG